jgi:hypothetical protein
MLGWIVMIGMCVVMAKFADAEDRSGILWGCLTFVLCLAGSAVVPYPFLGLFAGGIAAFVLMIVSKIIAER